MDVVTAWLSDTTALNGMAVVLVRSTDLQLSTLPVFIQQHKQLLSSPHSKDGHQHLATRRHGLVDLQGQGPARQHTQPVSGYVHLRQLLTSLLAIGTPKKDLGKVRSECPQVLGSSCWLVHSLSMSALLAYHWAYKSIPQRARTGCHRQSGSAKIELHTSTTSDPQGLQHKLVSSGPQACDTI